MQPDIRILVLSAGLNSAFHFIKTLKEKFSHKFYIIAADINDEYLISSFNYIDKFYKVPLSISPEYYKAVIDICKKENVNYILPSLDIDRVNFHSESADLKKLNIKSLCTSDINYNKREINKLLGRNGFLIPKIYNINELDDNNKYFVKPIDGSGSADAETLTKKQISDKENISEYLIEEVCKKPEITLECFYYNGRISTVARERIESKAGVCSKAKVYKSKKLEDIAKKFTDVFDAGMYFNLQFMKNSDNEYVITDVNFRLAGAMGLSYAAGWDEVSALASVMLKKTDDEIFSHLKLHNSAQYVLRTYNNSVTKSMQTIAFDLDGTVLNSFERHKTVLQTALNNYGISLNLDDYIDSKRCGLNNIQYLAEKGIKTNPAEKIQNFWINNIENEEYLNLDFLYPEAVILLNKLKENSVLILITARNNRETCSKQINKLKLDDYFSEIYIVKPDKNTSDLKAEVLLKTLSKEMYGDTETDKEACNIANIKFNPVSYGFRNINLLLQSPPPRRNNINQIIYYNNAPARSYAA